jgi:hypothetical protein
MPQDINVIKRKLAKLARQKDKRDVGAWPEDPPKWEPGSVRDPRSKKPFTYPGAWDFIAEELEKKHTSIKPVPLIAPRGKVGYAFLVSTEYGTIYIKVRLARGKIIARSFHYSEKE